MWPDFPNRPCDEADEDGTRLDQSLCRSKIEKALRAITTIHGGIIGLSSDATFSVMAVKAFVS